MSVLVVCVLLFSVFNCVFCHSPLSRQSLISEAAVSPGGNESLYRLPHNIIPQSYHIHMTPYFQVNNFMFDGNLIFYFNVVSNTTDIILNSVDLTITDVLLNKTIINSDPITLNSNFSVNPDLGRLTVTTDVNLTVSDTFKLQILYKGLLRGSDDLHGFYYGSYTENNKSVYFGATQFEAVHARKAFPCLDEPGFRAQVMVHIKRQPTLMTVSNAQLQGQKGMSTGEVMDIYQLTEKMPSYLVAFFIGEFSKNTQGNNSVYARNEYAGHTDYALSLIPTVLEKMKNFVTIPFMLNKLDIVAIPDFMAGAMENWGMVTFREEYSLFAQGVSNELDKKNILTIICHEFSHQWFGDLITPAWWSDLWLNEGFARYFQYVLADLIEPNWRLLEDFTVSVVQSAFAADNDDTHPMTFSVLNDNDIKFDTIVYSKAASVIRMWEHAFTRGVFQTALTTYLTKVSSADSVANTDDLFASFETAVASSTFQQNFTVTDALKSWTFASGYPVVNVAIENGKLYVEQRRFSTNSTVYDTQWYIPLTYTTQKEMNFNDVTPRVWLQPNQKSRVSIADVDNNGWVIVNLNQAGYYRVNYSESIWQSLISQLKTDLNKIPPTSRAQLIDDAFTFAKYNQLSYTVAFSLANYLVNETDYVPWVSATRHLKYIIESFYYFSGIDQIKAYVYNLYSNFYDKVIYSVSEDHITKLARIQAFQWACELGYQPCFDLALNLYGKWLQGSQTDPQLKPGMLCTAVRLRPNDWTVVNNMYLESKVSTDKVVFLKALSCSDQKYLIHPFMKRALVGENKDVKRQNADIVLNALLETPNNINPVIVFLLNNYLKMKQYLGASTVNSYVSTIGNKVTAHSELNMLLDAADNELLPLEIRQQMNASYVFAKARHTWCHNIVNIILQSVSAGLTEIITTTAPPKTLPPTTQLPTTVAPSGSSALTINGLLILLSLVYICFRIS